jgi:hypothetical protein
MSSSWFHELSGLVAASASMSPGIHSEIRFRSGDFVGGIDLGSGAISTGEKALSEISGDESVFNSLLQGEISLQGAFRSGRIVLSGDPEPFLYLAMILERQRSAALATY